MFVCFEFSFDTYIHVFSEEKSTECWTEKEKNWEIFDGNSETWRRFRNREAIYTAVVDQKEVKSVLKIDFISIEKKGNNYCLDFDSISAWLPENELIISQIGNRSVLPWYIEFKGTHTR